jgi:carbon monoxide dehydrogenase subunit G
MSNKLEELLNLPEHKETMKEVEKEIKAASKELVKQEEIEQTLRDFDKVNLALPTVDGLGFASDKEFDELAEKATKAYEDLMDLGMNVEVRYSSKVFEVAAGMLKNAIEAKAAKIDKKLRIVDLQLKKQKLEFDKSGKGNDDSNTLNVTDYVVTDRNSLIEKLKKIDK